MLVLRWLPPEQPLELRFAVPQPPGRAPLAAVIATPGGTGGATIIRRSAPAAIGGHRAVEVDDEGRVLAWSTGRVVGVLTGAVEAGGEARVQVAGELVEPSWSWAPGPVWAGDGGVLTQLLPTAGALVEVGVSAGPTAIIINARLLAQL